MVDAQEIGLGQLKRRIKITGVTEVVHSSPKHINSIPSSSILFGNKEPAVRKKNYGGIPRHIHLDHFGS
jgi:hypothetical protein